MFFFEHYPVFSFSFCFLGTVCCSSLPLTPWLAKSLMLVNLWSGPYYPSGVTVLQGQSINTKWSLELYVLKSSIVDSISTVFLCTLPYFLLLSSDLQLAFLILSNVLRRDKYRLVCLYCIQLLKANEISEGKQKVPCSRTSWVYMLCKGLSAAFLILKNVL